MAARDGGTVDLLVSRAYGLSRRDVDRQLAADELIQTARATSCWFDEPTRPSRMSASAGAAPVRRGPVPVRASASLERGGSQP